MDREKLKRRQSLKIVISEVIMVITVIVTVIVLALIVSGYWLNSDFEFERQGMLQVSSVPTGADVIIDDKNTWLQRTNTSKVLTSGTHTVTVTKEGYDSWTKTIDIREGLLYRLHYPRLFKKERKAEKVMSSVEVSRTSMSPDHDAMLIINNTTSWQYLDLKSTELKPKPVDVSKVFSFVSLAEGATTGLFTGEIDSIKWDADGSHVLIRARSADSIEWVLLDVKNSTKSLNLTREFSTNFSQIQILDNSSSTLLAIQNGNLHKIDVSSKQLSSVLVEQVNDFDHYYAEIIFSAKNSEGAKTPYYVGYLKIGDEKPTRIANISSPAQVTISRFYEQKYFTTLIDSTITMYPKNDLKNPQTYELSFAPKNIRVGHDGEFITTYTGNHIAVLDMEAELVQDFTVEGDRFGWIDNDMIYTVSDGELIVYDFDGQNRRPVAKNVSSHLSAGITDNKWMYYFSDNNLMREWIIEH